MWQHPGCHRRPRPPPIGIYEQDQPHTEDCWLQRRFQLRHHIDAVGEIGVVFETRKNEATKTRKRGSPQPSLLPTSEFANSIQIWGEIQERPSNHPPRSYGRQGSRPPYRHYRTGHESFPLIRLFSARAVAISTRMGKPPHSGLVTVTLELERYSLRPLVRPRRLS